MAKVPKKSRILVNGILFEELTKEHQERIVKRNTEVIERIVSSEVMKLISEGSSEGQIKDFLGIK